MKIAALQFSAKIGDVSSNVERIRSAAIKAAEASACLLVAPELAVSGYGAADAFRASSQSPAELAELLGKTATQYSINLIVGFAENAGDCLYNSAIHIRPDGDFQVYRKSHLYGDYEKRYFSAEPPSAALFDINGFKAGMLICYDVEFPENVRRLAVAGADLIVVPTALPAGEFGDFIAGSVVRVRAFENQVFLNYTNHVGTDGAFSYAGQSAIIAPDATVLARASSGEDDLIFAELDRNAYEQSRQENSYLKDLVT